MTGVLALMFSAAIGGGHCRVETRRLAKMAPLVIAVDFRLWSNSLEGIKARRLYHLAYPFFSRRDVRQNCGWRGVKRPLANLSKPKAARFALSPTGKTKATWMNIV